MTNKQNSKDPKEDEAKKVAEAAKKLSEDRIKNLETLIGYAGANYLKTEVPYGKKGSDAGNFAFDNFLTSEKVAEIGNNIYKQKVAQAEEMRKATGYNTISHPEYFVTNHEREMGALGLIQDAQVHLTLKELGDVIKKVAPGLKGKIDKIPGELNGISYSSIAEKAKKAQDESKEYKPTKTEETFIQFYGPLTQAYKEFSGLMQLNQATTQNYNSLFDNYIEGYKKMKEEDSKEGKEKPKGE